MIRGAAPFIGGDVRVPIGIPAGSVVLPGLAFAADPTTGFFDKETGSSSRSPNQGRVMGWAQAGVLLLTGTSRIDASGGDNAWFSFGSGQTIPNVGVDTYAATLGVRTAALAGASSTPVGFNIGAWQLNIPGTTTYTTSHAAVEIDKLDYVLSSGVAATVNITGALRARAPVPHDGVTILESYSFAPIGPYPVGTGTTTRWYSYYYPQGMNATAGTTYGLFFREAPTGGAIATHEAQDLVLVAGAIGTTTAHVRLQAPTVGGFVYLEAGGLPVFRADGSGSQQNFISLDCNNTPTFRARSATGATSVSMAYIAIGGGAHSFSTGGGEQFRVHETASAVNYMGVSGGIAGAGNCPIFLTSGSDSSIDIGFLPKGSGVLRFGTHSAWAAEVISGYITIKDVGGTLRKLAVIS
jgi:hypothetical protein